MSAYSKYAKNWFTCSIVSLSMMGCINDNLSTDGPKNPSSSPNETSSKELRFEQIQCSPDPSGRIFEEGRLISCTFQLAGTAAGPVQLSCEDATGQSLDCTDRDHSLLQPEQPETLPIQHGYFVAGTAGFAEQKRVIVWVARAEGIEARYRFEADVVADDGFNSPTQIDFACLGDSDGDIRVNAGDEVVCQLAFADDDSDTIAWSYTVLNDASVTHEALPFGEAAEPPMQVEWRWRTDINETGVQRVFRFSASDDQAVVTTKDLTITVQ